MRFRFAGVMIAMVSVLVAGESQAAAPAALGVEASAIEVAPPPAAYGTNATALRAVVAAELRTLEPIAGARKRVVVSLALAPLTAQHECNVDATLRDERTGALVAVIESATRAEGPLSAEQRTALAYAAVRRAVRRVPSALDGRK